MRLRRTLQPIFVALPLALASVATPTISHAQIAASLSITVPPPALPVYAQPAIPAPGYIWTPGYWAWGPYGYYWVPGAWVRPPTVGLLWTPGYWGWSGGAFLWHAGYWGLHVGFYGGVNYGFGYGGVGYEGGYWQHGSFFYNTAVNNVHNVHITNVYNRAVVNNVTRVSYNGGAGGLTARPTAADMAAEHDSHRPATAMQTQHERTAQANPAFRASNYHGQASFAANRPGPAHGQHPAPHPTQGHGSVHPVAAHQPPHPAQGHGNVHPAAAHQPPHPNGNQHQAAHQAPRPEHTTEARAHTGDEQHHD